jgi:hypothetical protein
MKKSTRSLLNIAGIIIVIVVAWAVAASDLFGPSDWDAEIRVEYSGSELEIHNDMDDYLVVPWVIVYDSAGMDYSYRLGGDHRFQIKPKGKIKLMVDDNFTCIDGSVHPSIRRKMIAGIKLDSVAIVCEKGRSEGNMLKRVVEKPKRSRH